MGTPGHKQTELGSIPEEWDVASLEQVSAPQRSICYGIVQVGPYTNGGVPVLAIKNLNTDYVTNIHRCLPEIEKPYARSRVTPGDVLISVKGTTGKIGLVPEHFRGNISRDIARLSLTDADDPRYWFQLLQSEGAQRSLGLATVGTTRLELSINILKQVRMPRPPKEEQRAIAAALSDVDALIGALDQLVAKKRALKQAAMQRLLTGMTRLPGFTEKWETKRFDEVFTKVNAKAYQVQATDYQTSGSLPIVDQGNAFIAGFTDRDEKRFRVPEQGVIVFGDHTCTVKFIDFDFVVGADGTQILAAKPDHSARFHALHLEYKKIAATGYNRHFKFLKERQFAAPPKPEQDAIAAMLEDMSTDIAYLEQRRDKTRLLKQGMMQELLTGRTRLV